MTALSATQLILFAVAFLSATVSLLCLLWILYWIIVGVVREESGKEAIVRLLIWPSLIVYAVRNRHNRRIRRCWRPLIAFVIGLLVFVLGYLALESLQP